jgi:DNA-binding LacI/PurR family transcriptional regulator
VFERFAVAKNITILEIAEQLDISKTTVYKALNDLPGVSVQTKTKVKEAANRLGYRPNLMAQSLRGKKTRIIGVLISFDFERRWYASLANKLITRLRETGYSALVTVAESENPEDEKKCLEMFGGRHIDGIIAGPVLKRQRLQPYWNIIQSGKPIVFFGAAEELPIDFVGVDNVAGPKLAVNHFVSCGHKRIGFLCCHDEAVVSNNRRYGFERAMVEAGLAIEPRYILSGRGTYESGYEAMKLYLKQKDSNMATAFFCQNDVAAIGAIKALNECGLSVPGDVSLIGYDNIKESLYSRPSLTTIGACMDTLVKRLQEILTAKINNQNNELVQELITPELVLRDSVAVIK